VRCRWHKWGGKWIVVLGKDENLKIGKLKRGINFKNDENEKCRSRQNSWKRSFGKHHCEIL
jgi:hypothetical protein